MSKVSSIENPVEVRGEYREQALTVEPHGIEQVSASERLRKLSLADLVLDWSLARYGVRILNNKYSLTLVAVPQ
jgi:hypothetical protein